MAPEPPPTGQARENELRLPASVTGGAPQLLRPAGTSADFEAESFSGSIRNELTSETVTEDKRGPGRKLRVVTGDGSARVYLKSFSGNVRIDTK